MSEAKYTPTPWNYTEDDTDTYVRQGGLILARMRRDYTPIANASRIVECVNALAGIENPREWVENIKNSHREYLLVRSNLREMSAEVTKLKAELEEYKTMESFHKSSSHDIRMLKTENLKLQAELKQAKANNRAEELLSLIEEESIIERNVNLFNDLRKDKPKAFDTDTIHKTELKQAKADAWDEGRDSTFRSDTPNPENPYKEEEEREPPTWEHPEAWADGFADNH